MCRRIADFAKLLTTSPMLRCGGLLLSDDALWNSAFRDFVEKVHEPDSRILRGVGFLRKSAE
jgi:hypothetical protein